MELEEIKDVIARFYPNKDGINLSEPVSWLYWHDYLHKCHSSSNGAELEQAKDSLYYKLLKVLQEHEKIKGTMDV